MKICGSATRAPRFPPQEFARGARPSSHSSAHASDAEEKRMADVEVAVVTGGARGLGFAIATALAKRGARVCLLDLSRQALDTAAERLAAAVPAAQVMVHAVDVSDANGVAAAVAAVSRRWGRVDTLVQAAGAPSSPLPTRRSTGCTHCVHHDQCVRPQTRPLVRACQGSREGRTSTRRRSSLPTSTPCSASPYNPNPNPNPNPNSDPSPSPNP